MRLLLSLWIVIQLLPTAHMATELLTNADMELDHFDNNWVCNGGCTLASSNDSYSGYHSVMVTNRHQDWHGPLQNVQVTPMTDYNFTAFIKLLTLETSALYKSVDLYMDCQNSSNAKSYIRFANAPHVRQGEWTKLGGVHVIPDGFHSCHVYVQVHGPHVNFLLDHTSLQMIPVNHNWRTEANNRIENLRKADVSISLTGATAGSYDVELVQTDHDFAFGSVVSATSILDPGYKKYQDVFYANFEWGVLSYTLKWRPMEPTQGHIVSDLPLSAIKALIGNGTKVRAHNIFWGCEQNIPSWVQSLSKADLLQAIQNRNNHVVAATKGLVEHWDVNNENVHCDWFEQKTGNPNLTMQMFRDAHSVDENVKLFLNDYLVMQGTVAMPLRNQATLFKDAGVPIYGVGIQSHIQNAHLDMTTLQANLDTVAEAGLPIWITELTVREADENLRASALTDLLTLYFSHPSVEGVLLWGFWNRVGNMVDSALFEGPDVTANAAGRAYQTLYNTTWRTRETRTLHGHSPVMVRGFMGHYNLTIKHNGHAIKSERFHLDKRGLSIEVNVGATSPEIIFG